MNGDTVSRERCTGGVNIYQTNDPYMKKERIPMYQTKKSYIAPEAEVLRFETEDVITTSGTGDNEMGPDEWEW